ncbi:MAG: hypothetical protein ACJ74W_03735 [Pyrinomonadaceae bacterium]
MAQTRIYHGTTVTEFVARHFTLLAALALFLGLALLAQVHAETLLGRAVGLFAFAATVLLWLALLFQCMRARPLTALMELLALVLLAGFGVVLAASVAAWWVLRPVALPVLCYMGLFLILDETGVSRRPLFARQDYQIGLRLLCLLAALLLAYVLKA